MLRISRVASLQGELRPPSDKSLTHRAYLLGAIADGPSAVKMPLRGADCEATLRCLEAMGLNARRDSSAVQLEPAPEWRSPDGDLDCGNSGTTMRLLSGLIASRPIHATLVGDESLSRRPMGRIAEPLRRMGAEFRGERPPIEIRGGDLHGIAYESPVASAQVKSCVLLAGLRAVGTTSVSEPAPSRDHTERMLRACGVRLVSGALSTSVEGGQKVAPFECEIPGDLSSAAFFLVAAAIVPGSRLTLRDVGTNPTRTGILDVMDQCRIRCWADGEREDLGEPRADLSIEESGIGLPFEINGPLVPRLIDEIPVLAVLATRLDGISRIRGASELRVKESDRIQAVAQGLRAMGATVETRPDGMDIAGPTNLRGARIDAAHDHRIAMAFAVAGLIADGTTEIHGAEAIATSYPEFESDLRRLSVW